VLTEKQPNSTGRAYHALRWEQDVVLLDRCLGEIAERGRRSPVNQFVVDLGGNLECQTDRCQRCHDPVIAVCSRSGEEVTTLEDAHPVVYFHPLVGELVQIGQVRLSDPNSVPRGSCHAWVESVVEKRPNDRCDPVAGARVDGTETVNKPVPVGRPNQFTLDVARSVNSRLPVRLNHEYSPTQRISGACSRYPEYAANQTRQNQGREHRDELG